MRKLLLALGTALLVLTSWVPAQTASASSAGTSSWGKRTSLHIGYRTSAIYQYDLAPNGEGTVPATIVHAVVKNCPKGEYRLNGSLVQNGSSLPEANDALGRGEYTCTGSKLTRVTMAFGSPDLRPGYAEAHMSFHPLDCASASCSFESTRIVRVPGKITTIDISPRTSKIYLYDASPNGVGHEEPTVATRARVRNCPDGAYRFDGLLVQDGAYVPGVRDSLGEGEMYCRGGMSTVPLSADFASVKLHPGWAVATFSFAPYGCEREACTYQATRVVHIPGKRPGSQHPSAS
jgi:hypothetical protein